MAIVPERPAAIVPAAAAARVRAADASADADLNAAIEI
jgi:hypothetical protein